MNTVDIEKIFLVQSEKINFSLITDKFIPKDPGCEVLVSELTVDIHKEDYILFEMI